MLLFVTFAVQNYVKNLKNVLFACSNITSQVGISNPRASRSREHIPLTLPFFRFCLICPLKCCRYNPVLGEFFRCRYDYPNGTQGFYIAEQGLCAFMCVVCDPFAPVLIRPFSLFSLAAVSHHPPISAFYYVSPANKVAVVGELRPKSKFLGNSVSTVMEGHSRITLLGRPEDSGKSIAHSSLSPFPHFPSPHEAKDTC